MTGQKNSQSILHSSRFNLHPLLPVCRLGLATRGGTQLQADDVHYALHHGSLHAEGARRGFIVLLIIRYNAGPRGAEQEVFPVADSHGVPVVVYTCLRWGALLRRPPEDPAGSIVPPAPAWYRFVLQNPS